MRHRDRRGRGMRGRLAPSTLPMSRTSTQRFDRKVTELINAIERHLASSLGGEQGSLRHVEFAVDDVPPPAQHYDADVVEDHGVALSRLYPAQPGTLAAAPRIVLYRRPLELRADSPSELTILVRSVLVEQISALLGIPVEAVDPSL
ncbi:metallopeptidase family protein [Natronoglycomyces albus]|uniref:Metallopeptidase family protein n=1 Tax=Natronoglycomyces albus TaxID=2811108 RepID=A0A895XUJ4_9ACTN|nr:metallopeptidase family protein [Natronoglycomyces albus]QSB05900.1 metallopeptidase family protein [Natronoglycomyces albus]